MPHAPSTPRLPSGRLLTGIAAAAVVACMLLLAAAAPPATSAMLAYPPGVERGFMKTCVPTAKSSSGGEFSRRQAKVFCRTAYRCLEQRLTFRQFQKLADAKGRIKRIRDRCTERAAEKALN